MEKFDFSVTKSSSFRDIVQMVSMRGYFDLMLYNDILDTEIPEYYTVGKVAENSTMVQIQ